MLAIANHRDNPMKFEQLLGIFDAQKKEPVDHRRGGVTTLFVGVGIHLPGKNVFGRFFEVIGLLVGATGVGVMIVSYFFHCASEEITHAAEKF